MQLAREIHLTKMGALAALGAITIGIQSPAPLNAQAPDNAGKTAYSQNCASCLGANIDDEEFAPPLKGAGFMQKCGGKPISDLIGYISSKMPQSNPGRLGDPDGATNARRCPLWPTGT
jgi:hypothetical protein